MFYVHYPISLFKIILMTLFVAFPICLRCQHFSHTNESSIQAVIFDLGGVVVEADRNQIVRFIALTFALTENEAKKVLEQLKAHWINGGSEKEFWEAYALNNGRILPSDWHVQWQFTLIHSIQAVPGTIEIIQELKAQGFAVPLLSNVRKELAEHIQKLGYYDLFEPVFLSYEIGYEKPDPRAFQILLKEIKLAPHVCLFIDDRIDNIEAAKELGIDTIQFFSSQQLKEELAKRNIYILK